VYTSISQNKAVSIKQSFKEIHITFVVCIALSAPALSAQTEIPEWCRSLPRVEYKSLQRVPTSDPWFEVYKVAPAVFAIYEPHQSEEAISFLIVGDRRACSSTPAWESVTYGKLQPSLRGCRSSC
jgi:hypothetical protein